MDSISSAGRSVDYGSPVSDEGPAPAAEPQDDSSSEVPTDQTDTVDLSSEASESPEDGGGEVPDLSSLGQAEEGGEARQEAAENASAPGSTLAAVNQAEGVPPEAAAVTPAAPGPLTAPDTATPPTEPAAPTAPAAPAAAPAAEPAPAPAAPAAEPARPSLQERIAKKVPDWVHTALDLAGLVPGVGEIADGANAALYTAKGDYANAAISAAAMIPGIGSAATGTRLATKAGKQVTEAAGENLLKMASNDLKPWLKGHPVGTALEAASAKTGQTYKGAQVYQTSQRMELAGGARLKVGDQYHLDTLHKNHLEVYNKNGNFTQAINLDGTVNVEKTQAGLKEGRRLPKR